MQGSERKAIEVLNNEWGNSGSTPPQAPGGGGAVGDFGPVILIQPSLSHRTVVRKNEGRIAMHADLIYRKKAGV